MGVPLRPIDLAGLDALLHGHAGLRVREGMVQPVRLPPADLPLYDPFARWMGATLAGVRLRMRTDSRTLRLTTTQRQIFTIRPNQWPARYELFVDGERLGRPVAEGGAGRAPDGPLIGDERAVLALDDLPAGEKGLELWFPQGASVAIAEITIEAGAELAPWPDPRPCFLAHGSSITHGVEIEGGTGSWPSVAAARAGMQAGNLGLAGSCLLSGLAARAVRDRAAAHIALELGINVWDGGGLKARTFRENAHAMLAIIREGHAATPITVVSPIASPSRERAGSGGGLSLEAMRELLQQVVAERTAQGDGALGYLSGLDLLGLDEGSSLPDGLHPSGPAYRRIGERFFAAVLRGRSAPTG